MNTPRQRPQYIAVSSGDFAACEGVDEWQYLDRSIVAEFRARSFADAGRLVQRIAAAADEMDHHPDVDLRYPGTVHVRLTTHDVGGVTMHDVSLARVISSLASKSVRNV